MVTSPGRGCRIRLRTGVNVGTEGKAFVNLEFDSPPNDPVPPQFVTDVGQKQDTAIKNGLHG